jgi:hypothetical protein
LKCSHLGLHANQSKPKRIGFETRSNYLVSGKFFWFQDCVVIRAEYVVA